MNLMEYKQNQVSNGLLLFQLRVHAEVSVAGETAASHFVVEKYIICFRFHRRPYFIKSSESWTDIVQSNWRNNNKLGL